MKKTRLEKRPILIVYICLLYLQIAQGVTSAYSNANKAIVTSVDISATAETQNLYTNLRNLINEGLMFGHMDDTAFGMGWWMEPGRSDTKETCGDYPAVYGWDIGRIEIGWTERGIGLGFDEMRELIKAAYGRGGIMTISWHCMNPVTGGSAWDTSPAVAYIIPGGSHHEIFKTYLDKVADYLNSLATNEGIKIPIIFRPYHEHNINAFWWGHNRCTIADYKTLWQFTVSYLKDTKGLHHLLYAFSPSSEGFSTADTYLERYPGDNYIDILGISDYYHFYTEDYSQALAKIRIAVNLAEGKNKIATLAELGLKLHNSNCWTAFLNSVKNDATARQISWLLVWHNYDLSSFQGPYPSHQSAADFRNFYNDPFTIFENDLPDVYHQPNSEYVTRPNQPSGPANGLIGATLTFSTSGSQSNYGHNVEYQFDWGDGQQSNWDGSSSSHIYAQSGTFNVAARARCQLNTNIISVWSHNATVTIMNSELSVSGAVFYYSNNAEIANTNISVYEGSILTNTIFSSATGNYNFIVGANKNIAAIPSKSNNEDVGLFDITTYDAALTIQAAIGLRTFSANEAIAADVNKDNQIIAYDAALIAQYAIGFPKAANSHVAEWLFQPESHYFENISSNKDNQNFTGIIIGNVHGGWQQPDSRLLSKRIYEKLKNITVSPNSDIFIPLEIESCQDVISAFVDFEYDPAILELKNIDKTCLAANAVFISNAAPGRVRIGIYSVEQIIDKAGKLIELTFRIGDVENQITDLILNSFQLNNDIVMAGSAVLKIETEKAMPEMYRLHQNYPNPFVLGNNVLGSEYTTFQYQIPMPDEVSLTIYNYLGQRVKTLVKEKQPAGFYKIFWNGTNETNEVLSAGAYFYRFEAGDYLEIKRLILFH